MSVLEVIDEAFKEEDEAKRNLDEARKAARTRGGHHIVRRRR